MLFLSLIFCKQEEPLLFFGSVSGCTCLILLVIYYNTMYLFDMNSIPYCIHELMFYTNVYACMFFFINPAVSEANMVDTCKHFEIGSGSVRSLSHLSVFVIEYLCRAEGATNTKHETNKIK